MVQPAVDDRFELVLLLGIPGGKFSHDTGMSYSFGLKIGADARMIQASGFDADSVPVGIDRMIKEELDS